MSTDDTMEVVKAIQQLDLTLKFILGALIFVGILNIK